MLLVAAVQASPGTQRCSLWISAKPRLAGDFSKPEH
jgi:hypothetical protein